jgi:formylglycine-generating enzyme required for sulfatase activity
MPSIKRPFYRHLILSLLCLFVVTACGIEEHSPSSRSNGTGSYAARLAFPPDIPRKASSANAVAGGIDCDAAGIAVINCALFAADETLIKKVGWQCSDHGGVVDNISPQSGITVVVTAQNSSGNVRLQGQDSNVTIYADRQTISGEIQMVPPSDDTSPTDPPETDPPETDPPDSFTNDLGMTFNLIPAGAFTMGSPGSESGRDANETQHQVTLTQAFYIQTTEVTQGQWRAVMGANPSFFQNCGENCPVESVSWEDVQEFLEQLNAQTTDGYTYRLPTEAEWEYAVRAGSETAFCSGDITEPEGNDPILNTLGWYYENSDAIYDECFEFGGEQDDERCIGLQPVESKNPNAWGLFDMHGNVWEWCSDWYGDYPTDGVSDPFGPSSGVSRVFRGGCWINSAAGCRSAKRNENEPGFRSNGLGFRLAVALFGR